MKKVFITFIIGLVMVSCGKSTCIEDSFVTINSFYDKIETMYDYFDTIQWKMATYDTEKWLCQRDVYESNKILNISYHDNTLYLWYDGDNKPHQFNNIGCVYRNTKTNTTPYDEHNAIEIFFYNIDSRYIKFTIVKVEDDNFKAGKIFHDDKMTIEEIKNIIIK